MVLLGWLRSGYYLANSFWVSRLGEADLAALGGSAFAFWSIHLLADLAGTGVHARVAQAEGGGDRSRIGPLLGDGLLIGVVVAAVLGLGATGMSGIYLRSMGIAVDSAAGLAAHPLLTMSLWLAGPTILHTATAAVFRGLGDTRTPLLIAAMSLGLNLAIDPLLIWGVGPFAGLGIAGVAVGTGVANLAAGVAGLLRLRALGIQPSWPSVRGAIELTRIGLPITVAGLFFCWIYVALSRIVVPLGEVHLAALGIGHRFEGLAYQVCVGFQVAAATLVGQWTGAGQAARARAAGEDCARTAMRAMWLATAVLALLADPVFRLYADGEAVHSGRMYLWTQCAVFMFMAWECVYEGAFTGLGRTVPPLVVSSIFTALRVPLALLLSPILGIEGVWLAIALSTFIKGVLIRLWFRRTTAT